MQQTYQGRRPHLVRAGFLLAGLLAGCYPDQACTHDAPLPPPAGTLTRCLLDAQAAKGRADRFVIYENEWYLGGMVLGPCGKLHVEQLAQHLSGTHAPVVIQPCAEPGLNQLRRQVIVGYLTERGIADAAMRVILASPDTNGLFGECEGERAFIEMLHPPYFLNSSGNFSGLPYGGYNGFAGLRPY